MELAIKKEPIMLGKARRKTMTKGSKQSITKPVLGSV
jgi:hypothetical protein